jgi:ferredoxin
MILNRAYYTELSWTRWAKTRMSLIWLRMRGALRRELQSAKPTYHLDGPYDSYGVRPVIGPEIDFNEMNLAQKVCPTAAIESESNYWKINDSRCIACGLCFLCAPKSLLKGDSTPTFLTYL